MYSWFTPRRVFWTLLLGSSLGFLSYGVVASRAADDGYSREYVAALIRAHTRQLVSDRDVARAASVAAATVYVAAKKKADGKVAAVPPVSVAGDTITFSDDSSFVIPHRVTLLLLSQRGAIAAQDSALQAADELLARFRVERDATDSLHAGLAQENRLLRDAITRSKPSMIGRAWGAVRTPLTFVAGVAVGAYAVSRVAR